MKEAILLEQLINENNNKVKLFRKQLSEHENGDYVLSRVILASTETSLEEATEKLKKFKILQDQIDAHDTFSEKDKERILKTVVRKKLHDNHTTKTQEEKNKEQETDKKLEALGVVDEVAPDAEIDENQLFEVAIKPLTLTDEERVEIEERFLKITSKFNELLKRANKDLITSLTSYNHRIPIIVLHFSLLVDSIKDTYEKNEKTFSGFPKYQDWWIDELWTNHHAYYGIYKIKEIISIQCPTQVQKQSWQKIFDNWLSIKLYLNSKGKLAYPYTIAFDTLISIFTGFEEEVIEENLASMEKLLKNIILKDDFTKIKEEHTNVTSYMRFKKKALLKEKVDEEDKKE